MHVLSTSIIGDTLRIKANFAGAHPRFVRISFKIGPEGWERVEFDVSTSKSSSACTADGECSISIDDISRYSPFSEITLSSASDDNIYIDEIEVLSKLYAFSEEEFDRYFLQRTRRIKDAAALMFACKQILDHYELNLSQKIVAGVVFGYRSLDKADTEPCVIALGYLIPLINQSILLPPTNNTRTDGQHLALSLCMVVWQLQLAAGLFDDMNLTLGRAVDIIDKTISPPPPMALNASMIICIHVYLLCHIGSDEIDRLVSLCVSFYKNCLSRQPENLIHLSELYTAHFVMLLVLRMQHSKRRGRKLPSFDLIFDNVIRVKADDGRRLLRSRLEHLIKRIRIRNRKSV